MATGVAVICEAAPFIVRVANLSKHERMLVRGQILGMAVSVPAQVLAIESDSPAEDWRARKDVDVLDVPSAQAPPPFPQIEKGGFAALLSESPKPGVIERINSDELFVE